MGKKVDFVASHQLWNVKTQWRITRIAESSCSAAVLLLSHWFSCHCYLNWNRIAMRFKFRIFPYTGWHADGRIVFRYDQTQWSHFDAIRPSDRISIRSDPVIVFRYDQPSCRNGSIHWRSEARNGPYFDAINPVAATVPSIDDPKLETVPVSTRSTQLPQRFHPLTIRS